MATQTLTDRKAEAFDPARYVPRRPAARAGDRYDPGPEGYLRPDVSVRAEVSERLSDDDELDARGITVTVFRGQVRFEGCVADRYCKRRATLLALAVTGVRDVDNRLRVRRSWLREWSDWLRGNAPHDHRGHAGGGTHNAPRSTSLPGEPSQFATL